MNNNQKSNKPNIRYRPHRGSLEEAMLGYREFDSISQLLNYIVEDWQGNIKIEDISS